MTSEQDSASDGRLRKWLVRTVEREPIDRFVVRHDTGAEVATVRADDGGTFERTERQGTATKGLRTRAAE